MNRLNVCIKDNTGRTYDIQGMRIHDDCIYLQIRRNENGGCHWINGKDYFEKINSENEGA